MLHKRRLPDTEAADLKKVYDAKIKFLNWLLRTTPPAGFGTTELELAFGKSLGKWFAKKIKRGANLTTFGKEVECLRALAASDPTGAIVCDKAIKHDAKLDAKWNTPGFAMRFSSLPANWRDTVKPVGASFYDRWLSSEKGFPKAPFGLTATNLTRKGIMSAFRLQSRGVCGYCDDPLGNVGSNKKEANDCDHFFPKSQWPHLAIHPRNLYAACKGCNETWKLDNAPMGNGSVAELRETYHPEYRAGADAITVTASLAAVGGRSLSLCISDNAIPRRAETLNAVLDLESRWTNDVNERLDGQISELVAGSVQSVKRLKVINHAEIEAIVDDCIFHRCQRKGQQSRAIREIAVLEFQRANQIAELLAECVIQP